jgi:hypothetical protein
MGDFLIKKEKRKYIDIIVREEAKMRQLYFIAQSASLQGAEISSEAQEVLKRFDKNRRFHQTAIFEASRKEGYKVCCKCGVCCSLHKEGDVNYHSIDYWLRKYTDRPIPYYDEVYVEHPLMVIPRALRMTILREMRDPVTYMYYLVRIWRIVYTLLQEKKLADKREVRGVRGGTGHNIVPEKWIPCIYLIDHGCMLDPSVRCISCIIHTCYDFRIALEIDSLKDIAKHMIGLRMVLKEVLNLLINEKKLSYSIKWARLFIPILPFGTPKIYHVRHIKG